MTPQFEYDFERIKIKGAWWSGKFDTDYREIIEDRARTGWRLVTIYAPAIAGYGAARWADLIFERPKR